MLSSPSPSRAVSNTAYAYATPRSPFQLLSASAVSITRSGTIAMGAFSGSITTPNDDRIPIEVHDGLYVMATTATATYHHFIELLSHQTYGSTRPCSVILHWTARWRTHILLWRRVSYASYSPSTPSSLCRRLAPSRQRLARCLHLRLRHPTTHRRCKRTH
jgi:hypothetical protein